MTGPKHFSSTDHLSPEAVAAYVDNELSTAAYRRAQQHLAQCPECRDEVAAQRGASERVRGLCGEDVRAPSSLVAKLSGLTAAECGGAVSGDAATGKREKVEQALRALRGRDRPRE